MNYKLSNRCYQISILLIAVFFAYPLKAQVMVGNSTSPKSFSLMEIDATYLSGGLRLPQLTTVERDNLNLAAYNPAAAANGLVIYNTDTQCIEFWDGVWVSMCNSSDKIILGDLSHGGVELDVTDPFPANAVNLLLIPSDTPDCTGTNPYTAAILLGGGYVQAVPAGTYATDGKFNLTIDANPSSGARMAILRVTDNCRGNYRDFLLVQLGCDLPATPDAISGQKFASTDGVGVTYKIDPVAGAASYTWTLPDGWTGSSSGNTLFAKPGAMAQSGTISVKANNDCGSSEARLLDVTVVHGCGAMIDANTWKEFMCWNLGADATADPFIPSAGLNGDYYQWGYKNPSAAYDAVHGDVLLGTPVDAFGTAYPDPVSWSSYRTAPGVYGNGALDDPASTVKSATDPCPEGYRIPNPNEWTGVKTFNASTPRGSWADDPGAAGAFSGSLFGDALFLPAAGYYTNEANFTYRGYMGSYWSSALSSDSPVNAYSFINIETFSSTNLADLSGGFSVRCIKQ